jgi:hypothetical protein
MRIRLRTTPALVAAALLCAAPVRIGAQTTPVPAASNQTAPKIALSVAGATVQDVTIETYGVSGPDAVRQFLSLKKGEPLEQSAVDRDYANLSILGGYKPRLTIEPGSIPHTVTLHWIVMAKWFQPITSPFYANQPLVIPTQGVGFTLRSQQISKRGANFSANIYFNGDTYLVRPLFTTPLHVNPVKGSESDFVAAIFGQRNVYRESQPNPINVYSWNAGAELLYYLHGVSGTQLQAGVRLQRSSSAIPTGIVSPFLYPSNVHPAHNLLLVAGYAHACEVPVTQWFPPHCKLQYRLDVLDAIGGFGASSTYQAYIADFARYFAVGTSTLALHAAVERTGGVIPDSFLACAGTRGYPKPFCGTGAQLFQAEFRIADAVPSRLHFVLFTETAASRVRGAMPPFTPNFQWWPDSGIGVIFRGFRLNLAYGKDGGRITYEFQGAVF